MMAAELEVELGGEEGRPKVLDADVLIDEILAKKGPQKYRGGLSEETWEQELEHIPLFMTETPNVVDADKAPGLAALQDLKYELSFPEGRAAAHKEEGNYHFRLKEYPQAVEEYSAGLKEGGGDRSLLAILFTNRAAAHFHLGNFRSCLNDVVEAQKMKPDHLKALHRGALACVELECYGEAVEWCDQGLGIEPENTKLRELRAKATRERKQQERKQRKLAMEGKAKEAEKKRLLDAIESRGIQLARSISLDGEGALRPSTSVQLVLEGSHPGGETVHFDPEGRLVWPVLFLYPEHGQTDLISAFSEEQRFEEHLEVMFGGENRPPWDKEGTYTPHTLEVEWFAQLISHPVWCAKLQH